MRKEQEDFVKRIISSDSFSLMEHKHQTLYFRLLFLSTYGWDGNIDNLIVISRSIGCNKQDLGALIREGLLFYNEATNKTYFTMP